MKDEINKLLKAKCPNCGTEFMLPATALDNKIICDNCHKRSKVVGEDYNNLILELE